MSPYQDLTVEDDEGSFVYGGQSSPRNGDVFRYLEVGKERKIILLFRVIENPNTG